MFEADLVSWRLGNKNPEESGTEGEKEHTVNGNEEEEREREQSRDCVISSNQEGGDS